MRVVSMQSKAKVYHREECRYAKKILPKNRMQLSSEAAEKAGYHICPNANGDCQYCLDYLRSSWPIEEYREDVRVKSIFCFVITPRLQRQGIATQLVERVCMDAAGEGYDFVEAYVNSNFIDTCQDFRGPVTMYEKCGFVRFAERDGKTVMRKALRQQL